MKLAYHAHRGQTDKSGIPYIFHPIHLAEQMDDEYSCAAALLHDTVEDTAVTLDDLRREFPPGVTDAIALLTHSADVDYFDYVRKIKENPIARKVKLADLAHNSDRTRLTSAGLCDPRHKLRLQKYARAKAILLGEEA